MTIIKLFNHKPCALPSNTIRQFDIQSNYLAWQTSELGNKNLLWQKKIRFFIRSQAGLQGTSGFLVFRLEIGYPTVENQTETTTGIDKNKVREQHNWWERKN